MATEASNGNVIHVGQADFDAKVLKGPGVVVVDFWAEWCGPCKMIAPLLDDAAKKHAGKLTVAKLNVDQHPDVAARYGVMSIPTLVLFRDGAVVDQMVGAVPRGALDKFLAKAL